ncbi:methyl-accepting chemotaxis protein [Cohnella lubricantis]|uniref:Cache domain-containing protein n=1 Tax=Cohnella lubricantis TaxID=2163172 RepID=A0A841TGX6_9BACL|nr:methyl-accepting chemotaxis protein [Cohnella lubricantis]MBB6678508.1 cache domain-containing protein [Cohnella lubricantis]MBP2118431.1 methyl-accepting chemotaxis protein [Cohnella lubricantis]
MKIFAIKSIRIKFLMISFALLVVPSLIIGIVGFEISKHELEIAGKNQLQMSVKFAIGLINELDQDVDEGQLSLEEAQERFREEILGPKGADNKRPIRETYMIGDSGYLYAVDKQGMSIMNPSNEGADMFAITTVDGVQLGKKIVELGGNGGGFFSYVWDNPISGQAEEKLAYVEADPQWGWIIGSGAYVSEFNQGANLVLHILLYTLGAAILIGFFAVWLFIRSIANPIVQVAQQVEKVAGGDLAMPPLAVKSEDEIGRLARDFNGMTSSMQALIQRIAASSAKVTQSSGDLTETAQQTSIATEQIALFSQEVADGAEAQMEKSSAVAAAVDEIASGMEQVAHSILAVADASVRTNQETARGNEVVARTIDQMNILNDTVEAAASVIGSLNNKSNEIDQIVSLISEIADQTKLLALNAAIEAARAGDSGRGFAVVADEVRKLATQSAQSTEEIRRLLQDIKLDARLAVQSIEAGTCAVRDGVDQVRQTGESFRSISGMIEEVSAQSQEVSAIVEEVSASSQNMAAMIQSVARISGQSAENAQQMAASTEEQLASMEEINASAKSLTAMAEELTEMIGRYKV